MLFNQVDLCFVRQSSLSTSPAFFSWSLWMDHGRVKNCCSTLLLLTSSLTRLSLHLFLLRMDSGFGHKSSEHFIMQWQQWAPLSAALTPLLLSTKWPSVLLREYNISCSSVEVPGQQERDRKCDWHRVTNSLNSDRQQEMNTESAAQGTAHYRQNT